MTDCIDELSLHLKVKVAGTKGSSEWTCMSDGLSGMRLTGRHFVVARIDSRENRANGSPIARILEYRNWVEYHLVDEGLTEDRSYFYLIRLLDEADNVVRVIGQTQPMTSSDGRLVIRWGRNFKPKSEWPAEACRQVMEVSTDT